MKCNWKNLLRVCWRFGNWIGWPIWILIIFIWFWIRDIQVLKCSIRLILSKKVIFWSFQMVLWTKGRGRRVSLWLNWVTKSNIEWKLFKELRSEKKDLLPLEMSLLWPELEWREQLSRSWQKYKPITFLKEWKEIKSALFQWLNLSQITQKLI